MRTHHLPTDEISPIQQADQVSCCVVGDGTLTIQCCEILHAHKHHVAGIVTASAEVAHWARRHAVPSWPDLDGLRHNGPESFDYLFSIVNMRLVPSVLLSRARKGAINFHDGPLPRYAGAHATSWALINREPEHGVTWHAMNATVDTGDILAHKRIPLSGRETAHVLNSLCLEAGIETFEGLLANIETGALTPLKQSEVERSYFGLYKRPDAAGIISWDTPAAEIMALVHGLDFGPTRNPIGCAKARIGDEYVVIQEVDCETQSGVRKIGEVESVENNQWSIGCGDGKIILERITKLDGSPVDLDALRTEYDVRPGALLPALTAQERLRITELNAAACRNEEFWADRLADLRPSSHPNITTSVARSPSIGRLDRALDASAIETLCGPGSGNRRAQWAALFAAYLTRVNDMPSFDLGLRVSETGIRPELFAPVVPLRIDLDPNGAVGPEVAAVADRIAADAARGSFLIDVVPRYPGLSHLIGCNLARELPVQIEFVETLDQASSDTDFALRIVIPQNGERCRWKYDRNAIADRDAHRVAIEFDRMLAAAAADASAAVFALPLLSPEESNELLVTWNATQAPVEPDATIHGAFEAQAERTPDATAVTCGEQALTYRELNERANQLARHLRDIGVETETLVAIAVERSVEMVVGLLGILKAGGAYLPLDPAYPAERLAHMLEDSGAAVLLTNDTMLPRLPRSSARLVLLDVDWPEIEAHDLANLTADAGPENLAYVIYTSGSTGRPKGVMVEHRNVTNFFAGMDRTIELGDDPVWLAVTSLSFDISVLEIFWTLARGVKVVIHTRDEFEWAAAPPAAARDRPIDFSLFYFSAEQGEAADQKYRLLLEGARFADAHGFKAVWTPERHFHEFGGLYPNPSVTGAALAVATRNVEIRSGSIVAPLHSPIRIAEEWSVVDNLSGGRVGLSFASGWMPDDFVIKPENFENRKAVMMETIETVRRLWRGDVVEFPAVTGDAGPVGVRTLPRPIQPELPVWVTTAGNPETYEMAARAGANVLTHLLGQSIDEVADKVRLYRDAWQAAGHPGRGCVSLMLHTFVSDTAEVREMVREPLKAYLRTSASLIKSYSWAFPTFTRHANADGDVNFADLGADELDEILDHAFERYYETSGLFGRVAECEETVANLKAHDIDDIACLIDFGIATDGVLDALSDLDRLRAATSTPAGQTAAPPRGTTIAELIERHRVTHFQCTPSMASLLLTDEATRTALTSLRTWLVGGEALPADLAASIRAIIKGDVINMYGPTETTVWSTVHRVTDNDTNVPIGRPIANTKVYVVDRRLRPVAVGVPGELVIAGAGVVRGYLGEPSLTADRFVDNPFASGSSHRIYRTGDLVRYREDGTLDFIGRLDHQIKVRGHRIELGEIEACLRANDAVREAVAVVREDTPGDKRIAAYILTVDGAAPDERELRANLAEKLPAVMVPDHIVRLDAFPLTPNRKIDRARLPVPVRADQSPATVGFETPVTTSEKQLAGLWKRVLGVEKIGRHDNFFQLGGHSLSAVQVIMAIRNTYGVRLSFKTLMEQPDLAAIASELERLQEDVVAGEI